MIAVAARLWRQLRARPFTWAAFAILIAPGVLAISILMGWQILTWIVPFQVPWHYAGVPAATVLDGPRLVVPPPRVPLPD